MQYESLHNITQFYDYVVLDEIRSVVSCVTSVKTNGPHLRTNAVVLRKLIKEAKLSIVLDADLEVDGAVPFFLQSIMPSNLIHLVRYAKTRIKRTIRLSEDEVYFVRNIKERLRAGRKVAIGCQSKQRANM